jgi:hypothetical protein
MILDFGVHSAQMVSGPMPLFCLNAGESACGSASNLWDDSRGEEPPIHCDTLARNISGCGKAEERNQPGYLFRFSDSAKGRLAEDSVSDALIGQKALSQIRFDEPWSN